MSLSRATILLSVLGACISPAQAQTPPPVVAEMRDFSAREHRVRDFVLDLPGTLQIDATGATPRTDSKGLLPSFKDSSDKVWPAAAWIVNVRTREVVWDLRTARTTAGRHGLVHFAGAVSLPADIYELHYGSYPGTSMSISGNVAIQAGKVIGHPADANIKYSGPYVDDGSYHQFAVTLRGAARAPRSDEIANAHKDANASIVAALHARGPSSVQKVAFALDRNATVELTATGEISGNQPADYGWLIDAETRHTIWRMSEANTLPAGGAVKNRRARQTLMLTPGRYVAYFVTDDSHDPTEWNGMPPLDPESWGMALRIANPAERAGFKTIAWEPVPGGVTLASITRVGNNETRSAEFALRRPTDVRIYALGEASGDQMADYAWLMNVERHQRVWAMNKAETEPAGGAAKNREYDGVVHLEPGTYRVYYTTDNSHAYGDWNDTPPAEQSYWGVSLWPASGKADAQAPVVSAPAPAKKILAQLTHVGNDINAQVPFHLDADGSVHVYAIGEGTGGDMDDYAWIEDATTGRKVWEMTYGITEHAGGAQKNRSFNGDILLKAGQYRLHFKSDDSHSYGHWNDDPPDDPEGWGVTVSRGGAVKL